MNQISPHYLIHPRTMAVLPARHMDYHSIVMETDQVIYVRQKPIQIMKESCMAYLASYEGRKEAVIKRTAFKRKIPIPINPSLNLYAFPTHATNHFDCSWILYHHVLQIKHSSDVKSVKQSIIQFKNGAISPFDVSSYILQKQMDRTLACIYSFPAFSIDEEVIAH